MKFFLTFLIVCVVQALLVTSQEPPPCSSTLADLNAYCDSRTSRSNEITRIGPKGPPGPQGPMGVMNTTAIEEIVKRIVYSDDVEAMMRKIMYEDRPSSCQDVNITGAKIRTGSGGVFYVYPDSIVKTSGRKVEVFCDLETDGGGWTIFQRRTDGSEDFYRDWDDYVNGFGQKDTEFWLGLENLNQMTKNGEYELRIDVEDFDGNQAYAKYGSFSVDSSAENYKLHASYFSGNAGDSLHGHDKMQFSTANADHDSWDRVNCAQRCQGGWWYSGCLSSNLNGPYHDSIGNGCAGVVWYHWKTRFEYLKSTEMKFRRK